MSGHLQSPETVPVRFDTELQLDLLDKRRTEDFQFLPLVLKQTGSNGGVSKQQIIFTLQTRRDQMQRDQPMQRE